MNHIPIASTSIAENTMTNACWADYFEANRDREARLPWESSLTISASLRAPLVRTLQRFHLGESGEGTYLKRWAQATGDADYCRAIDLFVAEEQTHSRWFGVLLGRLEAPALTRHWSDTAFTIVRRAGGLPFELMTFLVAEIIGKRFFAALSRNINCPLASAIFRQVVRDEAAHIAFHIGTLQRAFAGQNVVQRRAFKAVWKAVLLAALGIFCHDHAALLRQLQISRRQLKIDCLWLFEDVVRRVYAPAGVAAHSSLPDQAAAIIVDVLRNTLRRKESPSGIQQSALIG